MPAHTSVHAQPSPLVVSGAQLKAFLSDPDISGPGIEIDDDSYRVDGIAVPGWKLDLARLHDESRIEVLSGDVFDHGVSHIECESAPLAAALGAWIAAHPGDTPSPSAQRIAQAAHMRERIVRLIDAPARAPAGQLQAPSPARVHAIA